MRQLRHETRNSHWAARRSHHVRFLSGVAEKDGVDRNAITSAKSAKWYGIPPNRGDPARPPSKRFYVNRACSLRIVFPTTAVRFRDRLKGGCMGSSFIHESVRRRSERAVHTAPASTINVGHLSLLPRTKFRVRSQPREVIYANGFNKINIATAFLCQLAVFFIGVSRQRND